MKQFILLCFLLISSSLVFSQQTDVKVDCPKLIIEGPRGNKAEAGDTVFIRILPFKKAYRKSHTISYVWTSTNGRIIGGENNSSIYVLTKGLENEKIKVSVVVSGLEKECKSMDTISIDIVKRVIKTVTKEFIIQGTPHVPSHY